MLASCRWPALGTTVSVLVWVPPDAGIPASARDIADQAAMLVAAQLDELDRACSRALADTETRRLPIGTEVGVSPGLNRVLAGGLRAARRVLVPHGVELDGASAKAYAADRAAASLAARLPGSFLVDLGGDLAISGPPRPGGWRIGLDTDPDDDGSTEGKDFPIVTLRAGGMATSSTDRRTWATAGRTQHHIVDPRTGEAAEPVWRAVTVTAASCELASAAATAAIVLGADAAAWLARHGLDARLVSLDGAVVYVGDWPPESGAPA